MAIKLSNGRSYLSASPPGMTKKKGVFVVVMGRGDSQVCRRFTKEKKKDKSCSDVSKVKNGESKRHQKKRSHSTTRGKDVSRSEGRGRKTRKLLGHF